MLLSSVYDRVSHGICFGSGERTPQSGALPFGLGLPDSPFTRIVVIWDIRIIQESEDIVLFVGQSVFHSRELVFRKRVYKPTSLVTSKSLVV